MIKIENTFAEAFPMKCSRLIVTAHNKNWVKNAAESFCGFATSSSLAAVKLVLNIFVS